MKNELISVVVPAYNCGPWLPGCLDSILNQTYSNLEIIVVNDGSTDETSRIMEAYAQKDCRVRCIHKENGGVTSARLCGVQEARGVWIGFADGDDELEPEMIEHLAMNASACCAQISHCGYQEHYSDGSTVLHHGTGILKTQDTHTALRDLLEERIVEPSLCTKLFHSSLFEGIQNKMDSKIKNNEDMLMNYFLFTKAKCAVFEDVCPYHYLIHQGSASRRKPDQSIIYDPIRVRQLILDLCDPEMKEDARRALVRMSLVSYRIVVMETAAEYAEDRKKIRSIIREQLPYCSILPRRNAVLVKLISKAPWVFGVLYPTFERLFRK
jgi:glycosyltransferase involved in cell wall biosynthesis